MKSVWIAGIDGTVPTWGRPGADARAQDAAASIRIQAADDLVAGALRVSPRVEPDVDALLNARHELVQNESANEKQTHAQHDV